MRTLSSFVVTCIFLCIGTLSADCAHANPTDKLQLISVGADCGFSSVVFNKAITEKQMRTGRFPDSTFAFITDYCDNDRIGVGIFGTLRNLTRESTTSSFGVGAPYTDGTLSIKVRQGKRRLKIVHPPPAACDEGFLESTEYFDAVVTVKNENSSFEIKSSLLKPGCTKVQNVKLQK